MWNVLGGSGIRIHLAKEGYRNKSRVARSSRGQAGRGDINIVHLKPREVVVCRAIMLNIRRGRNWVELFDGNRPPTL